MSSDNDRLMVKNKHVLKHLAKSGSENPKQKKKKKKYCSRSPESLGQKSKRSGFSLLGVPENNSKYYSLSKNTIQLLQPQSCLAACCPRVAGNLLSCIW